MLARRPGAAVIYRLFVMLQQRNITQLLTPDLDQAIRTAWSRSGVNSRVYTIRLTAFGSLACPLSNNHRPRSPWRHDAHPCAVLVLGRSLFCSRYAGSSSSVL